MTIRVPKPDPDDVANWLVITGIFLTGGLVGFVLGAWLI